MVHFLIRRPIAVTMTFIAILVLGVFAMNFIPVSLMPDIDIPEITVQISVDNTPARELENTVVQPIRRQLMQVAHLGDITSETRNESALIHLEFDYGTDIDFAFIEVNEKIDRAMNSLPRDIDRPKVIKANATDIPVFYLNLTVKKIQTSNPKSQTLKLSNLSTPHPQDLQPISSTSETLNPELYPVSQKFVELSRFASNVIRKRIEQLSEVAMVDISGLVSPELLIMPDTRKLEALGITQETLEELIESNNIKLGNLLIRDGQYQYNIRFSSTLQNKKDIEDIYIKINERLLQLKDIATVVEHPQKQKGKVIYKGQDAITIAVIKQSDAQMSELKQKLNSLLARFKKDYPDINFSITRNQTQLLDYSIANLGQSLAWGALLAFLIMFLFLKDLKAPMLIGITIPTSLVISMLFFYVFNISINIISLSGIILGVGMMVDNSIIVIDNITQHRERLKSYKLQVSGSKFQVTGFRLQVTGSKASSSTIETTKSSLLESACANGTNEVFRPMLSSVLTTCAVFIPLIFISGITGALFYDQAMAITIGLMVSLAVSVTLLPVYYRLLYRNDKKGMGNRFLKRLNFLNFEKFYVKGFRFVMKKQGISWGIVGLVLLGVLALFFDLDKSKLPPITQDETLMLVDWNERIHIDENRKRTEQLISSIDNLADHTCLIGEQQFILEQSRAATSSEVVVYLKASKPEELETVIRQAGEFVRKNYPHSLYRFKDAGNIFNMIFSDTEKPLVARLRAVGDYGSKQINFLQAILAKIREAFPAQPIDPLPVYEYTILRTDPAKLLLYDVTFTSIYNKLKTAFNENQLLLIADNQNFVPVILGNQSQTIRDVIAGLFIRNQKNEMIPVRNLVSEEKGQELKTIMAGKEGEYYPVSFDIEGRQAGNVMQKIRQVVNAERTYEVSFGGSILSNKKLMKELLLILCVSLALLYFILSSQFESLTLPLIVLMEVPVDIFGALLALKLDGEGINLMSLIGIVVMSGIIINDSILKIDTINQLRNEGYSLLRAMTEAGHRRLKPILMTSLTTILALVPFLFTSGLGSDLQRPLALAVIGGMTLGTLVSLFLVPLGYYYLKRKT